MAQTVLQIGKVKGVMIDLDGTMIDSAPDLRDAVNMSLGKLGYPNYSIEQTKQWIGNGLDTLLHRALTNDFNGRADEQQFNMVKDEFLASYQITNGKKSTLYHGVKDALDYFGKQGCKVICITNKARSYTLELLKSLGILDYFDLIIGGDDVQNKKPNPEALINAMQQFKLAPDECLMIGDSKHDVEAANRAGIEVCCVSYGYSQGADLAHMNITGIIDRLSDVRLQNPDTEF